MISSNCYYCFLLVPIIVLQQAAAWTHVPLPSNRYSSTSKTMTTTALQAVSREDFLKVSATAVLTGSVVTLPSSSALAAEDAVTLPNGVSYTVTKSGTGPKPDRGELVAIRFAAYDGDNKIDDIFDTPEPYYTRVGSGGLIKGVEDTLPLMRLGDRWVLSIPGPLAFGKQGRPSSPGKPRIAGDATITFDVEMVGLPGKEPELIELIGDY